jgi:hypothetical protein
VASDSFELVDPDTADAYDPGPLIGHLIRAQRVSVVHSGEERIRSVGRSLCEFFAVLRDDETFWSALDSLDAAPQPTISALLAQFNTVLDKEHELLLAAGLNEPDAADALEQIELAVVRADGRLPLDGAALRAAVDTLAAHICADDVDLATPERRRRRWRLLATGLGVAKIAVTASANLVAPPPLNAISFGAAAVGLGQQLASRWAQR